MKKKSPILIWENIYLCIIPLLFSCGIAVLFYPGFMSYDTLHALHGAREGVTDSMWPPMVSYVWRVVDLVSNNPSAMHFSQVFLLLFSVFFIIVMFTKKIRCAVFFLILYLSLPTVLGTIAVIWKDVLMAAFFLASFAIICSIKNTKNTKKKLIQSIIALLLLFVGICSRHNAITGAVPLLFFLAWVLRLQKWKNNFHCAVGVLFLSSLLTGTMFFAKSLLDQYSLPHLIKMQTSTNEFIQSVRILDIAGASVCVNEILFDSLASNLTVNDIKQLYEPKHINLSTGLFTKLNYKHTLKNNRINTVWWNIATHHPLCFFYNKFQLTKYLIGANEGAPFLITAPSVDNNEYGYRLAKSSIRDVTVAYIIQASELPFFKPWFLYILSIGAIIYLIVSGSLLPEYTVLTLSAIFYFISLVLFGNAADARLPFYTTTILFMLTFISFLTFIKELYKKNHE